MSEVASVSVYAKRQTRRKIGQAILSLVAPIGSAVFLSGMFAAHWSSRHTVAVTLMTAAGLVLYWIWHRSRYPANINPPEAI